LYVYTYDIYLMSYQNIQHFNCEEQESLEAGRQAAIAVTIQI